MRSQIRIFDKTVIGFRIPKNENSMKTFLHQKMRIKSLKQKKIYGHVVSDFCHKKKVKISKRDVPIAVSITIMS